MTDNLKTDIEWFLDYVPDWAQDKLDDKQYYRCISIVQRNGQIVLYFDRDGHIYLIHFGNHQLDEKIKKVLKVDADAEACANGVSLSLKEKQILKNKNLYMSGIKRNKVVSFVRFILENSNNIIVKCNICYKNHMYRMLLLEAFTKL